MSEDEAVRDPQTLRIELEKEIDEAEWAWIQPFAKREQVVLVMSPLSLLEAGIRFALDDKIAVSAWLDEGRVRRPDPAAIEAWSKTPQKKFMVLVIQPFVLAQEVLFH